ncbi:MAG: prepilin-type N-terminal cleavage/methylation domain-containing protein [Sulfuricella sp.]
MKKYQSGFTLVEIAIVLVIIGLLLGGVLKGQEMIENARIKSIVNDMNGVSAAYNSYMDRYHAIPGDETAAVMTARGWLGTAGAVGATANNGVLNVAPGAAFTNAGEQAALWRALRGSLLTTGDPAAPAGVAGLPRSGTGGLIGVATGVYGMPGPAVCVSGLTTKQAAGVDATIDGAGAANNTGNARGATSAANPLAPAAAAPGAATPYNETATVTTWTMCRTL